MSIRKEFVLKALGKEAPCVTITEPNDLWTVDFKGWWRTGDGERFEPLTVRDAMSRFVLGLRRLGPHAGKWRSFFL